MASIFIPLHEINVPLKRRAEFNQDDCCLIVYSIFNVHALSLTPSAYFAVVPQSYSVNVMDEHVLRGNAGIVKCHIPSFVIDFVFVEAWILEDHDEANEIYADQNGIEESGTYCRLHSSFNPKNPSRVLGRFSFIPVFLLCPTSIYWPSNDRSSRKATDHSFEVSFDLSCHLPLWGASLCQIAISAHLWHQIRSFDFRH